MLIKVAKMLWWKFFAAVETPPRETREEILAAEERSRKSRAEERIRYARWVEGEGQPGIALDAYEEALRLDPSRVEVLADIRRAGSFYAHAEHIRKRLTPIPLSELEQDASYLGWNEAANETDVAVWRGGDIQRFEIERNEWDHYAWYGFLAHPADKVVPLGGCTMERHAFYPYVKNTSERILPRSPRPW